MARVTVGVAHDSLTIGQNLLLFIGNCLHIIEIFSCKTKQPKQTNNQTRTNLGKKYQLVHSPLMKTYHDLTDSNKSLQRRMYMYQRQKVYNCLVLRLFRCSLISVSYPWATVLLYFLCWIISIVFQNNLDLFWRECS